MKRSPINTAVRLGALNPATSMSLGMGTLAWGPSSAAAYAAAAITHPMRAALVDDFGTITYLQLELRTSRVAAGLIHRGVDPDKPVGLLCRNHRGFVEANLALAKLGARTVYLNPGLPTAQLLTVIDRERIGAVVADADLLDQLHEANFGVALISAAPELDSSWTFPDLSRWRPLLRLPTPLRTDDPVVLTSGTTGAPKGTTRRASAGSVAAVFGVLEAIPYTRGDVIVLPAPLFHAWGLSQLLLAASLAGTVVLRRHFDPAVALDDVEARGADVLAAVPVMLQRMLDSFDEADLSSLRIVATSGSALPGDLATRWMDAAGPTLYSLYGSTEVGQICVADPEMLSADSAVTGLPLRGVEVRIIDGSGNVLPSGAVGRVVAKSSMHFEGYTDGRTKEVIDSFMDSGDLGRIDISGLLTVVGRADDMIISGGENIFPTNIERAILGDPDVADAVAVGVADPELGQRVRAVVVAAEGARLTSTGIRTRLRKELARHEVPREIVIIDQLPRNASGKVLRSELIEPTATSDIKSDKKAKSRAQRKVTS